MATIELPGGYRVAFTPKGMKDDLAAKMAALQSPQSQDDIRRKYDKLMFGESLDKVET